MSYKLSIFLFLLILFVILESLFSYRQDKEYRLARWWTNALLALSTTTVVTLSYSLLFSTLDPALFFSQDLWPFWKGPVLFKVLLAFLGFDLLIYWQHRLFHEVPFLWRLHRPHHMDRGMDVSTALRFHPLEGLVSLCYRLSLAWLFQVPLMYIVAFEIVLNGCALFHHSNISLPSWLNSWLEMVFVTPDMHRIHHSPLKAETNSNYGFCLTLWDRLFRSYSKESQRDLKEKPLGLEGHFSLQSFKSALLSSFQKNQDMVD